MRGRFRTIRFVIDRISAPTNDVLAEGIFRETPEILRAKESRVIRLVIREEHRWSLSLRMRTNFEKEAPECFVLQPQYIIPLQIDSRSKCAALVRAAPNPSVSKPDRRQQMENGRLRPA